MIPFLSHSTLMFLCLLCQLSNPFFTLVSCTGQCVVTVVLPCLQSGSCPGGRNVCPWSAPDCASLSSSGSSPTPSSSSPPPSTNKKTKTQFSSFLSYLQLEKPAGKVEKHDITSWYFFVCQSFHSSQCSSNCGSRLGAERAAHRHRASTTRGNIMASYWKTTGQQVRSQEGSTLMEANTLPRQKHHHFGEKTFTIEYPCHISPS